MLRMVEVGPGSTPLCTGHPKGANWQQFEDSDYTAVQPDHHVAPGNPFPPEYLKLPNVHFIRGKIEDAGLAGDSFDEAFAANVLSDPSSRVKPIIDTMASLVKPGGLLSFLETISPEEGPKSAQIAKVLSDRFSIMHDLTVAPDIVREPDEWTRIVGMYSQRARERSIRFRGRFLQLRKNP